MAATQGPGLIGALLVGLSTRQGAGGRARSCRSRPSTTCRATWRPTSCRGDGAGPSSRPFVCLIASGGHTLLAQVREHDGFEVLGQHARRRRRRGLRQGREDARARLSRRRRAGAAGGGGDPAAFSFPGSAGRAAARGARRRGAAFAAGLDFSFAGVKTALLYTLRELPSSRRAQRASDLAASYQAAIVESLLSRAERALERTRQRSPGGGRRRRRQRRAAPAPAGARRGGPRARARPLHGQRGDDRQRGPLHASASSTRDYLRSTPTRAASVPRLAEMALVTVYSKPDCHLCERRDGGPPGASAGALLRARGARHHAGRSASTGPISSGSPWSPSTARSCANTLSTRRCCESD